VGQRNASVDEDSAPPVGFVHGRVAHSGLIVDWFQLLFIIFIAVAHFRLQAGVDIAEIEAGIAVNP
jgi:hypothetical protein